LKGAFVAACFSWAYGYITALKQVGNLGISCLSDFLQISELNSWRLAFKFIYVPIMMIFLISIILRVVELGGWQF
jgi:hypothetical protein